MITPVKESATENTRRGKAHSIDNAVFRGTRTTDSHGLRFHWTCPSSRASHDDHDLWAGPAGEEPSCSCEGYANHGKCALTTGVLELLHREYRARAARAGLRTLDLTDHDCSRKLAAGTITAQDRLIWSAICDELGERFVQARGRVPAWDGSDVA